MFLAIYIAIELLGLPVDIFNLVMVNSVNSIDIAKGLTALILNWIYMVINLIIMIGTAVSLIGPVLIIPAGVGIMIIVFFALNLPGLVLLFTQVNALLFISEAKRVTETVTTTYPPQTKIQIPPKPTQAGDDPRVEGGSTQRDPAEAKFDKQNC
jgi:hypothetical protein